MTWPDTGVFSPSHLDRISVDALEVNVEDEGRVGRDVARETAVTVTHVGGDDQGALLPEGHLLDALVPAGDDPADSDGGLEVASADGAVELVALVLARRRVEQPARVLDGDGVALFRVVGLVALFDELLFELGGHCD